MGWLDDPARHAPGDPSDGRYSLLGFPVPCEYREGRRRLRPSALAIEGPSGRRPPRSRPARRAAPATLRGAGRCVRFLTPSRRCAVEFDQINRLNCAMSYERASEATGFPERSPSVPAPSRRSPPGSAPPLSTPPPLPRQSLPRNSIWPSPRRPSSCRRPSSFTASVSSRCPGRRGRGPPEPGGRRGRRRGDWGGRWGGRDGRTDGRSRF